MEQKYYISVDFDGTCVTANFPLIGYNIGAQYVLKRLIEKGHKIILNTLRGHVSNDWNKNNFDFDILDAALNWFKSNNIELYGINKNPDQDWTDSPKPFAHFIIDDYAVGCPLINIGTHYFVDWIKITDFFYNCGVFDKEDVYYLNSHILKDQESTSEALRISSKKTSVVMEQQEVKLITRKIKTRFSQRHLEKLLKEIDTEHYENVWNKTDIQSRVKLISVEDKPGKEGYGTIISKVEITSYREHKFIKEIKLYYRPKTYTENFQLQGWGWIIENKLSEFLDKYIKFYILFIGTFGYRDKTAIPISI